MSERQPWAGRRLHFVGIGGAGMSGLALVAKALGASVTGSDRDPGSSYCAPLRAAGIEPQAGHAAEHVPDGAEVVYSTAIAAENPERRVAAGQELHRADLLGELTRLKPTIAITGTHGKTTTSSMVVHALLACGEDPSYLVGGEVRTTGTNAAWGAGEWLVVEADESDRSLLNLTPTIAVLTNAELDHTTTYASLEDVFETFKRFLDTAQQRVVWDRPELTTLAPDAVRYDVPDPRLTAGGSEFELAGVPVRLAVPGAHNALNAAAALTACRLAGADPARAAAALAGFTGAGRRFEHLGTSPSGARIVDDYAHHPTEVAATLAAARTLEPRRLVALFQPHLYSRTSHLHEDFGKALAAADVVVVAEIYEAREQAQDWPGVDAGLIAEATRRHSDQEVHGPFALAAAEEFLRDELREGDLLLTMGAGNVDSVGKALAGAEKAAPN